MDVDSPFPPVQGNGRVQDTRATCRPIGTARLSLGTREGKHFAVAGLGRVVLPVRRAWFPAMARVEAV